MPVPLFDHNTLASTRPARSTPSCHAATSQFASSADNVLGYQDGIASAVYPHRGMRIVLGQESHNRSNSGKRDGRTRWQNTRS